MSKVIRGQSPVNITHALKGIESSEREIFNHTQQNQVL